jgi:vitamin B12 transporter
MLIVLFFCHLLFSQTIPSIEVKETKLEKYSNPGLIKIEGEKLTKALELKDVLLDQSGLTINQNGALGGTTFFYTRGTEAKHTLVLWNGVRLNDPSLTERQFDGAMIRPFFIEKILFKKQPEPVLYGGDALGGVMEFIPKFSSPHLFEVNFLYGSFDTTQTELLGSMNQSSVSALYGVSRFKTNGISRLNKKRFNAKEADGTEKNQANLQLEKKFEISKFQLIAEIKEIRSDQDLTTGDTKKDHSKVESQLASLKYITEFKDYLISLQPSLQRIQRSYESTGFNQKPIQGENIQADLFIENDDTISGAGYWGEEYLEIKKESNRLFYLMHKFKIDLNSVKIKPGFRYDYHERYYSFLTPEVSVEKDFDHWLIFAKVTRGYKPPTLYQLYAPSFLGSPVGNEALTPEKGYYQEIGFKINSPIEFEASLFQNHLDNLIQYSATEGYQNSGNVRIQGADLSVRKEIYAKNYLRLGSTFLNFREEKEKILRRPYFSHQLTLETKYSDSFSSLFMYRLIGARKDLFNQKIVKLNPYQVLDVKGILKTKNVVYHLSVENIFNREYEDVYGYSTMPMSINLGLSFRI